MLQCVLGIDIIMLASGVAGRHRCTMALNEVLTERAHYLETSLLLVPDVSCCDRVYSDISRLVCKSLREAALSSAKHRRLY